MITSLSAHPRDDAWSDRRSAVSRGGAAYEEHDGAAASPTPVIGLSIAPDNSVRATVISGRISQGGCSQASSEEDTETTEVIYNTIVLPDRSKLLQIISKYADGTTRVTTTRLPGFGDDESGMTKDISKALGAADEEDRKEGDLTETAASAAIKMPVADFLQRMREHERANA